ncbi:hypothetical protein OS493_008743 [Desmophyllum pertusum]|uniref:Uncharacterized protein n=1 Tax=Desmophyllum pertusum TaxID=174260 RepID=A0A9X0D4I3_9CNID|nr:hypothetical protein OS493_008743 [Desmophyllum pertusum]
MATGSKIELGRIVLYVFFPVAIFFYFNMPGSYDDFMTQKKKELFPRKKTAINLQRQWKVLQKPKKNS